MAEAGDLNREVGTTREELHDLETKMEQIVLARKELEELLQQEEEAGAKAKARHDEEIKTHETREQRLIQELADIRGDLADTSRELKEARKDAAQRVNTFSSRGRTMAEQIDQLKQQQIAWAKRYEKKQNECSSLESKMATMEKELSQVDEKNSEIRSEAKKLLIEKTEALDRCKHVEGEKEDLQTRFDLLTEELGSIQKEANIALRQKKDFVRKLEKEVSYHNKAKRELEESQKEVGRERKRESHRAGWNRNSKLTQKRLVAACIDRSPRFALRSNSARRRLLSLPARSLSRRSESKRERPRSAQSSRH